MNVLNLIKFSCVKLMIEKSVSIATTGLMPPMKGVHAVQGNTPCLARLGVTPGCSGGQK